MAAASQVTETRRRSLRSATAFVGATCIALAFAGSCAGSDAPSYGEERFSVCPKPSAEVWGTDGIGATCSDAGDCAMDCCLCAHGSTRYAYGACKAHRCASVCDPINDSRAPICDGAVSETTDCWLCSHILNEALADGDDLGSRACAGAAAATWASLKTCVAAVCAPDCPALGPTNPCVDCIARDDADLGCQAELTACQAQ